VDLRACRFSGAIDLDKLRIDGSPQLAMRQGWQAHRRVLAEEHVWRHEHGPARRRDGWYPIECRPRDPNEARQILETEASAGGAGRARTRAQEIAAVYRALRKGREDSKDEPGAADLYYGEMEMRRKASGGSVEGLLLTGYWLLSGYGLRAWRALTALVALIAIATVLFATVGLARTNVTVYRPTRPRAGTGAPSYVVTAVPGPRPGWATALNYSVQSTTSLLRSPPNPPSLTGLGQALEIFLRFAGPGLLALAVLALRARVKR
jgi:hypothetical protein